MKLWTRKIVNLYLNLQIHPYDQRIVITNYSKYLFCGLSRECVSFVTPWRCRDRNSVA